MILTKLNPTTTTIKDRLALKIENIPSEQKHINATIQ